MVAIHSAAFMRRRATGEAHNVPGSHALRSARARKTKPNPRQSAVPATKYGRSGSNLAARPAPLRPSTTATSGPAQQSADPTAAATPPVAASTVLASGVVMVFQDLEDRAVVGGPSRHAGRGQPLERALHPLQVTNPLVDDLDLLPGLPLDRIAGGPMPDPQSEQLFDLPQREPELLRVLEADTRHRVVGVLAIPAGVAPPHRQHPPSLLIPARPHL